MVCCMGEYDNNGGCTDQADLPVVGLLVAVSEQAYAIHWRTEAGVVEFFRHAPSQVGFAHGEIMPNYLGRGTLN